jgi:hypothetical protein
MSEEVRTDHVSPPASVRARAEAIWDEYRKAHGASTYEGQSVGIDVFTGEVFVGPMTNTFDRLRQEGRSRPLFFVQKSEEDAKIPLRRGSSRWVYGKRIRVTNLAPVVSPGGATDNSQG